MKAWDRGSVRALMYLWAWVLSDRGYHGTQKGQRKAPSRARALLMVDVEDSLIVASEPAVDVSTASYWVVVALLKNSSIDETREKVSTFVVFGWSRAYPKILHLKVHSVKIILEFFFEERRMEGWEKLARAWWFKRHRHEAERPFGDTSKHAGPARNQIIWILNPQSVGFPALSCAKQIIVIFLNALSSALCILPCWKI